MKWFLAHLEIVHEVFHRLWYQHWKVVFVHLVMLLDLYEAAFVHLETVLAHPEVVLIHHDQVSGCVCRGFFF